MSGLLKKRKEGGDGAKNAFAAAALNELIPDISDELSVLTEKVEGAIHLADLADTQIVPTIFPGLNRASQVGGVPVSCSMLVHGPSGEGKSAFAFGTCASFQRQGHFTFLIDAEHTAEKKFAGELGVDKDQMIIYRPQTYEGTTKRVEKLINNFKKGRDSGKIHQNRCLLIVVDSITKLVPEKELEDFGKVGKGYPIRALLNTAWIDRLTPVVASMPILFMMIAHEKIKIDASPWEDSIRIKGGDGLKFESTMSVRVWIQKKLKEGPTGKKIEVGRLHKAILEKSKVGICNEPFWFAMSNGKGTIPIGFDHAREVLEELKFRNEIGKSVIRKIGTKWKGDLLGDPIHGDPQFLDKLRSDRAFYRKVVTALNEEATRIAIGVE